MPLDFLFGRKKTPQELLRQNQRALTKAMRELDRERQKMEQQEKKIIMDIKKMAKQGQMDAVKIMAKDLVRTRRYVKKFILMRANIQAVSLKIQTLKSNDAMAQAMKGVTKAMSRMNSQLKLPQIQKIMMEFEKQSEIMDMKEEMMNDAIDDAMGDDEDEDESDAIVSQVLDELGLQMADQLSDLPAANATVKGAAAGAKQPVAAAAGVSDADADLEARLENLRRQWTRHSRWRRHRTADGDVIIETVLRISRHCVLSCWRQVVMFKVKSAEKLTLVEVSTSGMLRGLACSYGRPYTFFENISNLLSHFLFRQDIHYK